MDTQQQQTGRLSPAQIREAGEGATLTLQMMRTIPVLFDMLSPDELRQLAKAAGELKERAELALDVAIAHQAAGLS